MKLPEWFDISKKDDDAMNPLESFIYHNEPAGAEVEALFRKQLSDMLDFVTANPKGQSDG